MLNRRTFVASAADAGLVASAAGAQAPAPRRYGYPGGTRPFAPQGYRDRRRRRMEQMKTGVAVIFGPPTVDRSRTVAPIDRQFSDFAYLTGLVDEPGAALLLAPGERTYREFLFLPPVDPEHDRWEGTRLLLGRELRERTGFEKIQRTGGLGPLLAHVAARAGEMH